jgi:hypothetical protein
VAFGALTFPTVITTTMIQKLSDKNVAVDLYDALIICCVASNVVSALIHILLSEGACFFLPTGVVGIDTV